MSSLFLQRDVVNDVVKYDIALSYPYFLQVSVRKDGRLGGAYAYGLLKKGQVRGSGDRVISQFSLDYCDLIC